MTESEVGGEKSPDRIAQPIARREEHFEPLVRLPFKQGPAPPARRSCAAFALVQEVLAKLALQPLGVGLLQAFHRFGGPRGRVLLRSGRVNGIRLLWCAAAHSGGSVLRGRVESE